MVTLEQLLESQRPGVRQNPYKYKIVAVLDIYNNNRNDGKLVKEFCNGNVYLNIENIPNDYMNHFVFSVEPEADNNGCLYLKIILL